MRSETLPTIDPIRELRLRTWARRNHVPLADRDAGWHPVVHDEMHRCDAEPRAAVRESMVATDIAPVIATEKLEMSASVDNWLHAALEASMERLDAERRELRRLSEVGESLDTEPIIAETASTTSDDWWSSETTISAYVPLPPGPFRLLDEPHEGVPAPHLGAIRPRVRDEASIGIPESW